MQSQRIMSLVNSLNSLNRELQDTPIAKRHFSFSLSSFIILSNQYYLPTPQTKENTMTKTIASGGVSPRIALILCSPPAQ
mmetsp:Transcript_16197/g.18759  ORF Transcript_16197/g.18759 Transcript_16197/m.18759 type:complete len:80 (-) Transcript_16197:301-540(-)